MSLRDGRNVIKVGTYASIKASSPPSTDGCVHKYVLPYPPQQNPATPSFPPGGKSSLIARAYFKVGCAPVDGPDLTMKGTPWYSPPKTAPIRQTWPRISVQATGLKIVSM